MNDGALADDDALAIFRSSSDQVWFGFADSRILMRDASGFHAVPLTRSERDRQRFGVCQGAKAEFGQVAPMVSRSLMQARFAKIQLSDGIALRGVSGIVEDKSHSLWFNAACGVSPYP